MATLILPYPAFTAGTPAVAAEVQNNFTTIRDHINGQNIGTANIETTLVSRVGGPILFLNQASQEQVALSILNSRTKSALQITQSAVLGAGSSIIAIDDNATQTTGDAQLYINTQIGSTIPAIKVNHGSDVTMSLTKTQLDLFVSATNASVSLFNSAIEINDARIKLPLRTAGQRDAVTQEGSILYNTTDKVIQYRNNTGWKDFTPTGIIQMFAGSTPPTGWLYCNGAVVSQTAYPDLFAVISTTYNTGGEGAGNFRLPNFVGIFPRGAEMGGTSTQQISGITYTGGANNTKQADQFQGHRHDVTNSAGVFLNTGPANIASSNQISAFGAGAILDPTSDTVNGTPRTGAETRPANIAIAYIIKT